MIDLRQFQQIDIKNHLRRFVLELSAMDKRDVKIRTRGEAEHIKGLLNASGNTIFYSLSEMRYGRRCWIGKEVDYIPSHLGPNRGFTFYFICQRCERRTKYLFYKLAEIPEPLCRSCCHLKYKRPSRRNRDLTNLLNRDYLSIEQKYWVIKRADITSRDLLGLIKMVEFDEAKINNKSPVNVDINPENIAQYKKLADKYEKELNKI